MRGRPGRRSRAALALLEVGGSGSLRISGLLPYRRPDAALSQDAEPVEAAMRHLVTGPRLTALCAGEQRTGIAAYPGTIARSRRSLTALQTVFPTDPQPDELEILRGFLDGVAVDDQSGLVRSIVKPGAEWVPFAVSGATTV